MPTVNVLCPRCGEKHLKQEAKEFKQWPRRGFDYANWFMCPNTKEPVIVGPTPDQQFFRDLTLAC